MRNPDRTLVSTAVQLIFIACLAACGGLAHGVSNDGNDVTNPIATNPGTPTLYLSAVTTDLAVGDGEAIAATYDGAALKSGEPLFATISDTGVVYGSAFAVLALAVGNATVTGTYNGSQATIGFSIHQGSDGADGLVLMMVNTITDSSFWVPSQLEVHTGANVRFNITPPPGSVQHNVVFDSIPGAPSNIAAGASGFATYRVFPTAGTFTYHCTLHGERGAVHVISP